MQIWAELRHLTPSDAVMDQMVRGPPGARAQPEGAAICAENKNQRGSMLSRRVRLRQACSTIQRYLGVLQARSGGSGIRPTLNTAGGSKDPEHEASAGLPLPIKAPKDA